MKFKVFVLSLLISSLIAQTTSLAFGNSQPKIHVENSQAKEKEILRLEEVGRKKVLNGDNNWDDLIADGAYMIGYDGSAIYYQKGQELPSLPVKSFKMSEMIVRVYGDAAVVTGLAEVESETPDKKPFVFQMRFLNVWKQVGRNWKIVVSERTGVRPPAK